MIGMIMKIIFKKKYGIPNYIDTMNTEKYKLNLKRTKLTGKY